MSAHGHVSGGGLDDVLWSGPTKMLSHGVVLRQYPLNRRWKKPLDDNQKRRLVCSPPAASRLHVFAAERLDFNKHKRRAFPEKRSRSTVFSLSAGESSEERLKPRAGRLSAPEGCNSSSEAFAP